MRTRGGRRRRVCDGGKGGSGSDEAVGEGDGRRGREMS